MKREIKFRAWDKEEKTMRKVKMIEFDDDGLPAWIEILTPEDQDPVSSVPASLSVEPDDVDLMQYTGMHDKNGREVYEGDIVKLHQVVLSPDDTIGWVEYTAQYGYSIRFGKRRCRQSDWATDEGAKYEVIGNIFENPELLEAQHD